MAIQTPPEPPQAPPDYKNAKAQAKAAKAFARAQRPWYKKKRFLFPLGLVLLVVVVTAAGGGGTDSTAPSTDNGSDTSTAPAAPANEPETEPPPATVGGPTTKMPIVDGDWRLDSIRVEDDGLGDFGGTGRVTYTGDNPEGGSNVFTLTVFVGGKDVAAMMGSADAVESGRAATVQFISTDKFVRGPYKYDFQNDL